MVESRLLADKIAVPDIPAQDKDILRSFIEDYVSNCEARKRVMTDRGVGNACLVYYIVESSAFCFFDDLRDRELDIWTRTITRAMEKKEIAGNVKPKALASLFIDLSAGYIACNPTAVFSGKTGKIEPMNSTSFGWNSNIRNEKRTRLKN